MEMEVNAKFKYLYVRTFLTILLTFVFVYGVSQDSSLKWTKTELDTSRTADTCSNLTQIEKDAIMYFNLVRLFPSKFAKVEIPGYFGTKKYGDYIKGSPYIVSLSEHLDTIQPLPLLTPVDSMIENAKCFSKEMGESGYTGHDRINCKKENKYAECGSFGMDTGKDIVMQMLIDHNIESLGHRKNCLNPTYTKIGLSLHTHTEWGHCCIIELMK
jgi:hypothetical protein